MADKASKQELMNIIPGLTKWRIDEARKHSKDQGSGMPVVDKKVTRERLCPSKIDHFLAFISQPHYLQDVAYGTKSMRLSTGETLIIPNVAILVVHFLNNTFYAPPTTVEGAYSVSLVRPS